MRTPARRPTTILAVATISVLGLTGCIANASTQSSTQVLTVNSTATECTLSAHEAPSGTVVFTVINAGDTGTEFYLLGDDKQQIVGEVENIGPGLSRDLVVSLATGNYFTTCKPSSASDGVGIAPFTVTDAVLDSGGSASPTVSAETRAQIAAAVAGYQAYVTDQVTQLVAGTAAVAAAYAAGDVTTARALYAPTRVHWERIETVAESFGDLDPKLDLREADLASGQSWTGWHAIEKDLWPANAEAGFLAYSPSHRKTLASQLVTDTETLATRIGTLSFSLDQLSNGAIGLLGEIATSKVTGEEEVWSHTDLWDFSANVEGARALYALLRPILADKNSDLAARLDTQFAELEALLATHRSGDGFVLYPELSATEIRALSNSVNALAEPLSGVTAALLR